jgi:RimJ/RimL family protein N-acetyltransferase
MTQTSETYHRAGPEDAEAIAGIIAELVKEANPAGFEHALSPEEIRAWFSRFGDSGAVFLCLIDGSVVGFSTLDFNTHDPDTATLGVWLLPAHRRRGLGTALAEWALDFARDRGYRRIRGRLPADNDAALSFLSSIGALVPIYNPEMRFELPL